MNYQFPICIERIDNTRNKGRVSLRLSADKATLFESSVLPDTSPPIYVKSLKGTLCNENIIGKKRFNKEKKITIINISIIILRKFN